MKLYEIRVSANPIEGIITTVLEFPCTINVNTGLVSYCYGNIGSSFHRSLLNKYRSGCLNTDNPIISVYTTDPEKVEMYKKSCTDQIMLRLVNTISIYSEILKADMLHKEEIE